MGFSLSPSVTVNEIDLTLYVPNVATSIGAFVGFFEWGAVEQVNIVSSERDLVAQYGQPNDNNAQDWFSAFNFLAYSNDLRTCRVVDDAVALNSGAGIGANTVETQSDFIFKESVASPTDLTFANTGSTITTAGGVDWTTLGFADGDTIVITGTASNDGTYTVNGAPTATVLTVNETLVDEGTADASATIVSYTLRTTAGDFSVFTTGKSVITGGTGQDGTYTINGTPTTTTLSFVEAVVDETVSGAATLTQYSGSYDATQNDPILIKNAIEVEANYATISASTNAFVGKYPGIFGNKIAVSVADASSYGAVTWSGGAWDYAGYFGSAPEGDEIYVVVTYDGDVVETFELSKDPAGKDSRTGGSSYIGTIINRTSKYIWAIPENLYGGVPGAYTNVQFEGGFTGGLDGYADQASSDDERAAGWDLFNDPEAFDINLLVTGNASGIAGKYVIDNIAEVRKDCVAFVSPSESDVVNSLTPVTDIVTARQAYGSSSYAVMDGNFKYQYDKYNDIYRWVPLNGDLAGVCAYTDYVTDPWYSPGGLNRGRIKNTVKLAFNPTKAQRDALYVEAVNPVVIFRGEGPVLFGDKTLQTKPSAFDRINVRRLFIVIEKAIATASKYMLFEFNDRTTRNRFINMVEPYLRTVQGRRGIQDFKVVCDETNNTGEVIDRNEFVGDIYVKPNKSINFIYLNFVAVSSSVTFEEVVLNANV